jgi:hypothetical protein
MVAAHSWSDLRGLQGKSSAVRARMMAKDERNVPQRAIQGQQLAEVCKVNVEQSWGGFAYCIIVTVACSEPS